MPRPSKYTAELLAPLVEASRSMTEVIQRLGLTPNGGNFRHISARVRIVGLDTSHFVHGKGVEAVAAVAVERLAALVEESTSYAQVLAKLGLPVQGRPQRELRRRIEALGIAVDHFRGQGWSRGESRSSHPSVERIGVRNSIPDEQVFSANGPALRGQALVRRLLAKGWAYECTWCGISEWRGSRLVLHLDHINGVHNDHRLVNLRFLCPNCHSQTDTYCKRRVR